MEKLNIAEILRHCPKGMELDCTMYENAQLDYIASESIMYPIKIQTPVGQIGLNKYGCYSNNKEAKCVIFPKGKTTWEGFQRPFKDGDIVFYNDTISIFKEWGDENLFRTYVCTYLYIDVLDTDVPLLGKSIRKEIRFATEKEKQKLFDAIKANGYKWNPETKTLEKLIEPKFKVGDWVEFKYYERKPEKVIRIENNVYWLSSGRTLMFQDESAWDLATKFDISTLKPFDKVLIRSENSDIWECDIFSSYNPNCSNPYHCIGAWFEQCIPYEGNEHLLGTTNDCDDYYKTWK